MVKSNKVVLASILVNPNLIEYHNLSSIPSDQGIRKVHLYIVL